MAQLLGIQRALREKKNAHDAAFLARFFKTGKGEYAEGDVFLGVRVPETRRIVKAHALSMTEYDIAHLLTSAVHEDRLAALLSCVLLCEQGHLSITRAARLYLSHTAYVNNWDLVDTSAEHIVGAYVATQKNIRILERLARSHSLWERRIAMLSCFYFIKRGSSVEALRIAGLLVHDTHDLMHKAVGWMLREVGKRVSKRELCMFLDLHAGTMPRTMLRYAIEHFPARERERYMKMR